MLGMLGMVGIVRRSAKDITYIHSWASFAYLVTVIDCYSKSVIGWAVADHMRTNLVIDALDMCKAILAIVYDLGRHLANPAGLENDLSQSRGQAATRALVIR